MFELTAEEKDLNLTAELHWHEKANFNQKHIAALRRAINAEDAIRAHRDQRGDDRCHLDDHTLYSALPEGYTPPERDTAVELANCQKFIECRQQPGTEYISPQRWIEKLETTLWVLIHTTREVIAPLRGDGNNRILLRVLDAADKAEECLR